MYYLTTKYRQKPTEKFSIDVNGMDACNTQQQPIKIKIAITCLLQLHFLYHKFYNFHSRQFIIYQYE